MPSTAPDIALRAGERVLHVMVGILRDQRGNVLISRRHGNVHLAGFWEFPGGKLEAGETRYAGLQRELEEELGVCVGSARPVTRVRHRFPGRSVLLDVWEVRTFSGTANGREGQEIAWVPVGELEQYHFPASNQPILRAMRLPSFYAVTPDVADARLVVEAVQRYLDTGCRMIQFRAPGLPSRAWNASAHEAIGLCAEAGAMLILNAPAKMLDAVPAAGVHLSAARLMQALPVEAGSRQHLIGASCHNAVELCRAVELGVDFVTLSPVQTTGSHPGQAGMGWDVFAELASESCVPVYALGGLGPNDFNQAQQMGAWGVAGISHFGQTHACERLLEA